MRLKWLLPGMPQFAAFSTIPSFSWLHELPMGWDQPLSIPLPALRNPTSSQEPHTIGFPGPARASFVGEVFS